MSVNRYDEALINHFREIFDDSRIHILPVEQAIRFTAQLRQDNIVFPLISTNRLGYSIKTSEINFNGLRNGGFQNRGENGINTFAQIIPIRINYQVDVFTVSKAQGDELIRELVFHIMLNPTLKVEIPYQLNMKHVFNIFLESDIVDNSDTVEHVNKGVLFRNTLSLYTDDAYLFKSRQELHGKVTGDVRVTEQKGGL